MKLFYTSFLVVFFIGCATQDNKKDNKNYWTGHLAIDEKKAIPFDFILKETPEKKEITIINGEEKITLETVKTDGPFEFHFPNFNSFLKVDYFSNDSLKGVFINNDRNNKKKLQFEACKNPNYQKEKKLVLKEKWEVSFSYDSQSKYPAIGLFSYFEDDYVEGTFLTETGDYRFLSGAINDNYLQLSCFDGSHVFLFEAERVHDSLNGVFYSGSHWKTNWYGLKNDTFELNNPYEITHLVNEDKLQLSKLNLEKDTFHFPNTYFKGKVLIIQVFGSWCPNCIDEIHYYNELYKKYQHQGLEIIGLGYETPKRVDDKIARLQKLKEKKDIQYTLLLGGEANKQKAAEDFPMLNDITSFPTTIIINKQGEIVKIHTGFNGPGTGEVYENYKKEMEKALEKLIHE